MKEEDFLAGLHYCLQRGYYSETVVKEFMDILEKNNFDFPDFEYFLADEEQFFHDKPLSNLFNRKATLYARIYSNAVYRIKILNELKKMKQTQPNFIDFIKKNKSTQNTDQTESTSEESPFIDGAKMDTSSSSESQSEEKTEFLTTKLIEESLIPKKNYLNLVNRYLELLERKDVLCYILSEETTSESMRVMQTEFFSYLHEEENKLDRSLTFGEVKARYLNVFK